MVRTKWWETHRSIQGFWWWCVTEVIQGLWCLHPVDPTEYLSQYLYFFLCKKESELKKYWMLYTKMIEVLPIVIMKGYRRSRGRGLPISNQYSGWRWVVSIMLWPIYLQKWNPLYPLTRRGLGGRQSQCGAVLEKRKIFCSCWECFENSCFWNVARYILFGVALEIVRRNVGDIVDITPLSNNCMV